MEKSANLELRIHTFPRHIVTFSRKWTFDRKTELCWQRGRRRARQGEKTEFFFIFDFFHIKTIIFIETVRLISNEDIKKSCALCDVCGNSLGIPSNKKPERIENDSPSTSD
ncbi:hypothetical protein LNQ52_08420 [Klebsiella pneumoniae subsp. pneumoniae]|nr:hypothetical protein [Klebsiella pneumoniae subsp. pneumoniae]